MRHMVLIVWSLFEWCMWRELLQTEQSFVLVILTYIEARNGMCLPLIGMQNLVQYVKNDFTRRKPLFGGS